MSRFNVFAADTLALHGGCGRGNACGASATSLPVGDGDAFANLEQAAAAFNLECAVPASPLSCHPVNAVLETRLSALENGIGAIAVASPQAALHLVVTTLSDCSGHIVAPRSIRGAARNLLAHTLPRFGITTTFVDGEDLAGWRAAIRPQTRLLLGETLSVPAMRVLDIPALAELAHHENLPLLVDATLATPCLQQPFEFGADLLFHSTAEFLAGPGNVTGGVLVDSGSFDWERSGRFPTLTEPYDGCHGIDCSEESPIGALLLRARLEGLHDFGAFLSPMNASRILQGTETLSLRMRAHVANAERIATCLIDHPQIAAVAYPGLPGHADRAAAERLLSHGAGAVLSVELRQGYPAARIFIESLRLFAHRAGLGGSRSTTVHPATTTHHRLSAAERAKIGINDGTVLLSAGLEEGDDLHEDIARALHAVERAAKS